MMSMLPMGILPIGVGSLFSTPGVADAADVATAAPAVVEEAVAAVAVAATEKVCKYGWFIGGFATALATVSGVVYMNYRVCTRSVAPSVGRHRETPASVSTFEEAMGFDSYPNPEDVVDDSETLQRLRVARDAGCSTSEVVTTEDGACFVPSSTKQAILARRQKADHEDPLDGDRRIETDLVSHAGLDGAISHTLDNPAVCAAFAYAECADGSSPNSAATVVGNFASHAGVDGALANMPATTDEDMAAYGVVRKSG
jgi:hypothetical protein